MNKVKLINIINYCIILISIVLQIGFLCIWRININYYYFTTLDIAILSTISMILLIVKAASSLTYTVKRFTVAQIVLPAFFGVAGYYLVKNLGNYEEYIYLYWLVIILIIPIEIVLYFLNKRPLKSNNGPKIIQNYKK